MKIRTLAGGALVVTMATATYAFASGVTVNTKTFASGDGSVTSCAGTSGTFAPTFAYTVNSTTGVVTSVAVGNIPASCSGIGASLSVVMTDGGTSIGTGSIPSITTSGGSPPCTLAITLTCNLNVTAGSPAPTAATVNDVHALVQGG